MGRVVKWISNVLLAAVLLTLAFFFLTPRFLGVEYFTIYSGSMMPTISVGSVVVVKPLEADDITVGDIITFRRKAEADNMVTHRVVEVLADGSSPGFRTAGDANASPDGSIVPAENIIGKVWFHVPFLGYVSSFVRTKLGFLLLMVLPAFFIIALELVEIVKQLRLIDNPPRRQPLRPARRLTQQPLAADVVNKAIPVSKQTEQTLSLVERPLELPLPLAPVSNSANQEPVAAETSKAPAGMKRGSEAETEAARIVSEIFARVRSERAAKQEVSFSAEPDKVPSAQAAAARIVADVMAKISAGNETLHK